MMSSTRMSHLEIRSSINLEAIRTLSAWFLAWPCSSMVSAITAAPCSFTRGMIFANREVGPSPSSKLTELTTGLPPISSRPAFITAGSVESITRGSVEALASFDTSVLMSATPSRPT